MRSSANRTSRRQNAPRRSATDRAEEVRATVEREVAEERARTHPRTIPEAFRGHYTRTGRTGPETLDLSAVTLSINANGRPTTNAVSNIEVISDEVITLSAGYECGRRTPSTAELTNRGWTLILSGCARADGSWARSP